MTPCITDFAKTLDTTGTDPAMLTWFDVSGAVEDDWTTVVIEPPKPRAESKGGTHASPRHHERRGHFRRTRSGKQVWVRNHKVGNPANGTVFHDYMVK